MGKIESILTYFFAQKNELSRHSFIGKLYSNSIGFEPERISIIEESEPSYVENIRERFAGFHRDYFWI